MTHPLDGSAQRMQMARTEFEHIDSEIAETRRTNRYGHHTESRGQRVYGPEDKERRYSYVVVADVPTEVNPFWGVRAGQVIYNLRCALDYMAWQLVIENTGAEAPDPRVIQFPILADPADFQRSRLARETMALISTSAQDFIKNVQPYNRGEYDKLGWLMAISNFDKHRTPVIATYALLDAHLAFEKPPESRVEDLWLHRGPVVDRAEIARFTLLMTGDTGATVKANAKFALQEVFEQPPQVQGKPLLKTIDEIRLLVGRILREANVLFRQPP